MDRRGLTAAVLFLLPFLMLARQGPLAGALPVYGTCLGAAFFVYAYAWVEGRAPLGILQVGLLGLAARLLLLPLPPSDDIYRFLWEGKVTLHGFSPYRLAPDHPYLAFLRDADWARINHPGLPTIYPPLAQVLFWALAVCGSTVVLFKLGFLACDLAAAWALLRWLQAGRAAGGNPDEARVLAVYFLNPLLIFEVAGRGHYDALAAGLNIAFVAALASPRARFGLPLWLGLGSLAKIASLGLAPLLADRMGWKRGPAWGVAVGGAVAAALWAVGAFDVLFRFGTRFRFNGAAAGLVDYGLPFLSAGTRRGMLAALFATVLAACLWKTRGGPPESRALACLGPILLFSPTLHPWYLIWLLPFAAMRLSRPWLLLTATSLLSYEVYARAAATGTWSERPWLRIPEYLPPLALWLCLAWRGRR